MFCRLHTCLLSIVAIAALGGCASSTSTNNNGPADYTLTRPKVGDTYVYLKCQIDSLGRATSDTTVVVDSIAASPISFCGRTNCVEHIYPDDPAVPGYFSYEWTGDIASYDNAADALQGAPGYRNGWVVIPLGSQSSAKFVEYDTVVAGQRHTRTFSNTYLATENITTAGLRSYSAIKILEEHYDENGTRDLRSTKWFDAQTGVLLKVVRPDDMYNHSNGGLYLELIASGTH